MMVSGRPTSVSAPHDHIARLGQTRGQTDADRPGRGNGALPARKVHGRSQRSYARLKGDPRAWREEQEERQAWETTLDDGLEEE